MLHQQDRRGLELALYGYPQASSQQNQGQCKHIKQIKQANPSRTPILQFHYGTFIV